MFLALVKLIFMGLDIAMIVICALWLFVELLPLYFKFNHWQALRREKKYGKSVIIIEYTVGLTWCRMKHERWKDYEGDTVIWREVPEPQNI